MTDQQWSDVMGLIGELWPKWEQTDERNTILWKALGYMQAETVQTACREMYQESSKAYPDVPVLIRSCRQLALKNQDPARWGWQDENEVWNKLCQHKMSVARGTMLEHMAIEEYIIRKVIGKNPSDWERKQAGMSLLRKIAANRRVVGDKDGAERIDRQIKDMSARF